VDDFVDDALCYDLSLGVKTKTYSYIE